MNAPEPLRRTKRGPKKEKILQLLQAGYSRTETANRVPCSIEWVDRVLADSMPERPKKRRKRLTLVLQVRLSPGLRKRIDRAAQLLATSKGDASTVIRSALRAWADKVVLDHGMRIPRTSRKAQMRDLEKLAREGPTRSGAHGGLP
jgi:uncharacterized protein (DUF1778 family)